MGFHWQNETTSSCRLYERAPQGVLALLLTASSRLMTQRVEGAHGRYPCDKSHRKLAVHYSSILFRRSTFHKSQLPF